MSWKSSKDRRFGALLLKLTAKISTVKKVFYRERGGALLGLHGQRPLLFENTPGPSSGYRNFMRFRVQVHPNRLDLNPNQASVALIHGGATVTVADRLM